METKRPRPIVASAVFSLVVIAGLPPAYAQLPSGLTPEEGQSLLHLRLVSTAVKAYQTDHGNYPGPTEGYVPADSIRGSLEPVYINELPTHDGWGNEILYSFDGSRASVLSHGGDGLADLDYTTIPTDDSLNAGDDLVWTTEELVLVPEHVRLAIDLDSQKRTMADIRSVAVAVESYKIDNGVCPGPTEDHVDASFLREFVQPMYIRTLPVADAWGNGLLYWSDGEHYRIVSNGRDGEAEEPYDAVVDGTVINSLDGDIIFVDGAFVQWPEGPQS